MTKNEIIYIGRIKRNLSLRELSELSGVAFPTISLIERGKTKPRQSTIDKLKEAFKKFDERTEL